MGTHRHACLRHIVNALKPQMLARRMLAEERSSDQPPPPPPVVEVC